MIEYSFKLTDGSRIDTKSETGLLENTSAWGNKWIIVSKDNETIYINTNKIVSTTVKEI